MKKLIFALLMAFSLTAMAGSCLNYAKFVYAVGYFRDEGIPVDDLKQQIYKEVHDHVLPFDLQNITRLYTLVDIMYNNKTFDKQLAADSYYRICTQNGLEDVNGANQ